MAKGSRGRLRRFAYKSAGALVLLLIVVLLVGWLVAPSLIENWFTDTMEEAGYEGSLSVDGLGVSESTIRKLSLSGQGVDLNVSEIRADYGFGSLIDGSVDKVTIREVHLKLDLDELSAAEDEPEEPLSLEERIRQWAQLADDFTSPDFNATMNDLNVTLSSREDNGSEYEISDANVTLAMLGEDGPVTVELRSRTVDLPGIMLFDLSYEGVLASLSNPVLSAPQTLRGERLVMTGSEKTKLPILNDLEMVFRIDDQWTTLLVDSLGFKYRLRLDEKTGDRKVLVKASLYEPVEIDLSADTQWKIPLKVEVTDLAQVLKMVKDLSGPAWPEGLEVAGGSLNSRITVDSNTETFLARDFNAMVSDLNFTLSSSEANGSEYEISDANATFAMMGLTLNPTKGGGISGDFNATMNDLNFTLSSKEENGSEFFLFDANATFAMLGEEGPVKVKLLPCFASLPGIFLRQLSYEGELASLANPVLSGRQTLWCKKLLMTGDHKRSLPILNDLKMNFRVDEQWTTLLLESLDFKFRLDENASEAQVGIRPQQASLTLTEDGGVILELNNTKIELPEEELAIEGLTGKVRVDSFEPLVIPQTQELDFGKLTFGELAWGPVKVAFSADKNGTFFLERCEGAFLGGTLRVEPARFHLGADEGSLTFTVVFEQVDAEELVKVMPGFEGELRGLLSGRISLSDRDGDWNFLGGGHIKLEPDPKGYLSYPSDGLLTEGMEPKSKDYKRSRLVELALQDLAIERLRLDFLEDLIEGRVIKGEILGASTVEKKKVKVTYRPNVSGDLIALLRQLEFAGLSFE